MLLATKFGRGSAPVAAGCLGSPISEATQHVVDGAMMQAWAENMQLLQTLSNMWHHIISQPDQVRWSEIYIDTIGYYRILSASANSTEMGHHQIRPAAAAFLRASRPACRIWIHTNQNEKIWDNMASIWHQYGINMASIWDNIMI